MFKRNSMWFGILIGILMPLIIYALLYGGLVLYEYLSVTQIQFDRSMLRLVAPVINLFFIRFYFVTKKFDETGRGLLLVTFIYVIAFFVIK